MKYVVLTVLTLAACAACFGQSGRTYSSIGGFGNVVYPGTGHAPNVNPGPVRGQRFNGGGGGYLYNAPRINHPNHSGGVISYPVIVGGYYPYGYSGYGGYGGDGSQQYGENGQPPIVNSNTAPSVVINQTFIPDHAVPVLNDYTGANAPPAAPQELSSGMRVHEGLKTPQYQNAGNAKDDQATLYLIAFKDHSIVPALGYWVESGNLHYVSTEHTLNQASLDLIDRDLSQRLNDERNIEFKLPK